MNTKEACELAYRRCTRTKPFALTLVGGSSWVEVNIDDVSEKDTGFYVDLVKERQVLTFYSGNDSRPTVIVTKNKAKAYDFICNFIEDFEE